MRNHKKTKNCHDTFTGTGALHNQSSKKASSF